MNFRELTTTAYSQYHDLIDSRSLKPDEDLLPYDYPTGKNLITDWQEGDFTRELVNKFNHFAVIVFRLRLWEEIISSYPEDDRYELHAEFMNEALENALGFPYRYRENVAFCATKICYIHGLYSDKLKKSDVIPEHKINIGALQKLGHIYPKCKDLIEAINSLGNSEYKRAISNFRNRNQHQMEPRLAYGQISAVDIEFPSEGGVGFSFGVEEPLSTTKCINSLREQIAPAKAAFQAYRGLIDSIAAT